MCEWFFFFLYTFDPSSTFNQLVMACGATLKRSMDFDPLTNPTSPKRRRCIPVTPSSAAPRKYLRMEPSPFGESSSKLSAGISTNVLHIYHSSINIESNKYRCPFIYFKSTRTNSPQHQTRIQTHPQEEASRWKLPSVRVLLFS